MAPTDFEKNLRERLGQREIRPSEDAWGRIAEQLAEPGRPAVPLRRRKIAIAAAACLLILLGLGFYGLLRNPALPEPAVVSPETLPELEAMPENNPFPNPGREEVTTLPERDQRTPETDQRTPQPERDAESVIQPRKSELAAELPVTVRPVPQEVPIQDTASLAEQINSQLDAVLAQVAVLESRQGGVSEAEIDSLLWQAQQEISGHAYHPPRDSVDAMALLMETEEELDRSFREQLFDRLKTGFARVRTAVATRND